MAADRPHDVVCVSYLAVAQILRVNAYPRPNSGAVIDAAAASIAGDGPLTAITAARLGLRAALITNSIGTDHPGQQLLDWLQHDGVHHTVRAVDGTVTPQLTVISDATTRTWFASLQHAYADLLIADLDLLGRTRLAYIDCYKVIADAAARSIAAAPGTPLILNLGGDQPDIAVIAAARGQHLVAVQTSLDEHAASTATDVADTLFQQFSPDAVIVTLGQYGALARTRDGLHRAAAPTAVINHTHGAGAAFSAGYAHAILAGADVSTALSAGCRIGTDHCASPAAAIPRRIPTRILADA